MKKIIYFYLKSCPYCIKAGRLLDELMTQDRYSRIETERVEESEDPQYADSFDYYYVPCFYVGDKKAHEGAAGKEDIERVLEMALE